MVVVRADDDDLVREVAARAHRLDEGTHLLRILAPIRSLDAGRHVDAPGRDLAHLGQRLGADAASGQDAAVETSGQLRVLAVSLMKIANDLRWMNSGPLAGLGEIALPALQPGSSIMPGKVNPVLLESAIQAGARVMGNDVTVTAANASGDRSASAVSPASAWVASVAAVFAS